MSAIDAGTNALLGTIALGDPRPNGLGALYNTQVDVHGLGFSPDGALLDVVSVTSNAVTLIEAATNRVRGTVYLGRAPHEGFFTPDNRELWVAIRGEGYVSVIDPVALRDAVIDVTTHAVLKRVAMPSPFSPNLAVSPDALEVWVTLKDIGRTVIVDALTFVRHRGR